MANLLMNYRIDGRFFLISPGENQKSPMPGILKGKEWLVVIKGSAIRAANTAGINV